MQKPPAERTPAAIPAIAFVTGLALAPFLSNGSAIIAGSITVAVLSSLIRQRHRAVTVLIFLFFGAGFLLQTKNISRHGLALGKTNSGSRFCAIRAPIGQGWKTDRNGGWRLRANHFTLVENGNPTRVDAPLLVILRTEPAALTGQKEIALDGFLEFDREREEWRVVVKSSRLVQYEGLLNPWHPLSWNRAIQRGLALVERAYPKRRTVLAMIRALVLGDASGLPREVSQIYRRSGTYHLLVFSGMQITMFAACIVFFFRLLQSPRLGDWILLTIAIVAPLFSGDAPAVSRASWMIGLYAFSRILHRPTTIENLYFVSALLRLSVYPDELYDGGFALTYAATGGLIFLGKPLSHLRPGPIWNALAYGLGAEVAIAPLTLLYFNQLALSGPFLTALIGPVLTVLLILGMVICGVSLINPSLTPFLLAAFQMIHDLTLSLQAWIGDHVQAIVLGASPPLPVIVAGYCSAILLVAISPRRALIIAILFCSTATAFRPVASTPAGSLDVHLLDVGQGDAILIRSSERSMLLDGGGYRDDPDFGMRVLVPLLLARGVRHLDSVALSHPHPDHCGGLIGLLEVFPVKSLRISPRHLSTPCGRDLVENSLRRNVRVEPVRGGMSLTEPFDLRVWQSRAQFKRARENNDSVLYRLVHGNRALLLTGDLEKESERLLLEEGGIELPSDILKVGHHGSRFSTTDEFLAAVRPRIALISSGSRNPFGHPSQPVIERLRSRGVKICRTDKSGNIQLKLRGAHIFIHREIDTR